MVGQALEADRQNHLGGWEVLGESLIEAPAATLELAREAWAHPWQTARHAVKTVGVAAGTGLVLGALIPARGPVAAAVGIAFTFPLVLDTASKIRKFYEAGQRPGADHEALGHALARDLVNTGAEVGLSVLGGYAGASAGVRLAASETSIGASLQKGQRAILHGENKALVGLTRLPKVVAGRSTSSTAVTGAAGEAALAADVAGTGNTTIPRQPWFAGRDSLLRQRIAQFDAPAQDYRLRMGSLHGHSRYSDGMGLPREIFQKARAEGLDFYAVTDHNHLAARGGIKEGDPRWADQTGTPTVAEKPIAYSQTFADAAAATQEGTFVALVGVEMGTIGKVGGGHAPGGGSRAVVERPVVDHKPILEGGTAHPHGHGSGLPGVPVERPGSPPGGGVSQPLETAGGIAAGVGKEVPKVQADRMTELQPGLPSTSTPEAGMGGTAPTAPRPSSPESLPAANHAHPDDGVIPDFLVDGTPVPKGAKLTPREKAIADLAAREASHYSGVNHINLFEVPTFFESVKQPRADSFAARLMAPIRRIMGLPEPYVVKEPPVVKYNDGDYAALVRHLDQLKDSTGGRPVIQLNHPRYLADHDPHLPAKYRGRDYGVKSFGSQAEWAEKFGKYASQIEVITGQAMNPKPVEHMTERDLGGVNLAGYVDKGLHVSPTYGRDDHFAMPGGRPAGTGIIADRLDKASLLEAMRQRRTMATTDRALLKGYTTANDRYVMGTILDQNAVQDLNITAHIGGDLAPGAQYKLTLWGDKKIGDRKLAAPLQTQEITGAELSALGGKVKFDQIDTIIGNKSAYWVEVQRIAPDGAFTDYMWTAPIWVEPLAGQHSLLTKALVGMGSQYLFR
ncbi:MAG TPA: PHP domain-containing protein [Candidatus Obscuribacterales bacterium]